MAEQPAVNRQVDGSSPSRGADKPGHGCDRVSFFLVADVLPCEFLVVEPIDTGHPRVTWFTPPVLFTSFFGFLLFGVSEAIYVEQTIEVVEFVLHDACKPALALNDVRFSVLVLLTQNSFFCTDQRKAFTRKRKAAFIISFVGFTNFTRGDEKFGIHGNAASG